MELRILENRLAACGSAARSDGACSHTPPPPAQLPGAHHRGTAPIALGTRPSIGTPTHPSPPPTPTDRTVACHGPGKHSASASSSSGLKGRRRRSTGASHGGAGPNTTGSMANRFLTGPGILTTSASSRGCLAPARYLAHGAALLAPGPLPPIASMTCGSGLPGRPGLADKRGSTHEKRAARHHPDRTHHGSRVLSWPAGGQWPGLSRSSRF
jgi:hypothetical protein